MKYTEALELAESLGINPAWFENPDSLIFAVELAQENLKMMHLILHQSLLSLVLIL